MCTITTTKTTSCKPLSKGVPTRVSSFIAISLTLNQFWLLFLQEQIKVIIIIDRMLLQTV
jgi:hypothetical protein